MTGENSRVQEFDALRGLSIVLLLVVHSEFFNLPFFGYNIAHLEGFFSKFLLGAFFFLAGYFMAASLQKPGASAFTFAGSKFIRIFPPYWLALALFVFVLGYSLKRFDAIVYLLNAHIILISKNVKPLLTLWYISLLVIYYIAFGAYMFRHKSNRGLMIWSVVVFTTAYIAHVTGSFFDPRFFLYFFIFLSGIFFFRFEDLREKILQFNILYKIGVAALGTWALWMVERAGHPLEHGWTILATDVYILGFVLIWLDIFRTRLGGFQVWSFLSTASFFAYLYHRPFWFILSSNFDVRPWGGLIYFYLIPGSLAVLVTCYFLQLGYDRLLSMIRLK
jgi:peptidoglycan/LPS O-acetylase OafA/YrhL